MIVWFTTKLSQVCATQINGEKSFYCYNKFSARNPPPICFGSPFFEEWVEVCLRFEDVDVAPHSFSGCLEAEAELKKVVVAKYKLGCFHIGHRQDAVSVVVI
jgi:Domain of unknown function (DUF4773)